MRAFFAVALFLCPLVACGGNGDDDGGGDDDPPKCVDGTDNCIDQDCIKEGLPDTTLTGRVFAPNGTLPLYGVNVYIPSKTPGPFPEGAQCSRCTDPLLGDPITKTQTDDNGNFTLINVPVGKDIPLVVNTGKWRRQITIPVVERCKATPIGEAETRLPKNKSEGDIPKIAITTGDADKLECLVRKLGVDDAEIGKNDGSGRINLYVGDGTPRFAGGHPGGSGELPPASAFWNSVDNLKAYDIVFLSCEGSHQGDGGLASSSGKPQTALDAMKAYADLGGRVFASHWHNIWVGGNFQTPGNNIRQPAWEDISDWRSADDNDPATTVDTIDENSHSKGVSFATWMMNVGGSTQRGRIELQPNTGRATSLSVDNTKAERWVTAQNGASPGGGQMFQFTTPIEAPVAERCGRVVFSDMHVSGNPPDPVPDYPGDYCGSNTLTPQEKALAFMFFDISSCVGGVF